MDLDQLGEIGCLILEGFRNRVPVSYLDIDSFFRPSTVHHAAEARSEHNGYSSIALHVPCDRGLRSWRDSCMSIDIAPDILAFTSSTHLLSQSFPCTWALKRIMMNGLLA